MIDYLINSSLLYFIMETEILCYSRVVLGSKTPLFLVDKLESILQLISNEVSDCIQNILWIFSQLFELGDLQLLVNTQFFTHKAVFY